MYAGARGKHNPKKEFEYIFNETWNIKFIDLFKKYQHKVILEIAGHDHWEDLRMIKTRRGVEYRPLLILTGVSPVFGQLPGFNTLKINTEKYIATNLVEYSLDITKTYGMKKYPIFEDIPKNVLNYSMEFNITELTA
jgi:hypothetical protein